MLAHLLEQSNLLSHEQITQLQCEEANLLCTLVEKKLLSPKTMALVCAQYFNVPFKDLTNYLSCSDSYKAIPIPYLKQYTLLPLAHEHNTITLAISDPRQMETIQKIKFYKTEFLKIVFVPYDQLLNHINTIVSKETYLAYQAMGTTPQESQWGPLADQIITDAIHKRASDIHLEPFSSCFRIRMRIDGVLSLIATFPREQAASTQGRLKILAQLDISEKRLPQDGRFTFTSPTGAKRDCRLNCCPTLFGEKLVLRLLQNTPMHLTLKALGMPVRAQKLCKTVIHQPNGLIIIAGPTGSGKTCTLYTILNQLNVIEKNISTIEDPIEIQLPGITQSAINNKIGLDFSTTLRAFLRQDPDIIMVGEIRDLETAKVAIRAAHTGHLVLSTLHTNNTIDSITRLLHLGVERYALINVLKLIIAQRLLRRLCTLCKIATAPPAGFTEGNQTFSHWYEPTGCESCMNGFFGRTGVYEMLSLTPDIKTLLYQSADDTHILKQAKANHMTTLWEAGLKKAQAGITSYTELHRVLEHPTC